MRNSMVLLLWLYYVIVKSYVTTVNPLLLASEGQYGYQTVMNNFLIMIRLLSNGDSWLMTHEVKPWWSQTPHEVKPSWLMKSWPWSLLVTHDSWSQTRTVRVSTYMVDRLGILCVLSTFFIWFWLNRTRGIHFLPYQCSQRPSSGHKKVILETDLKAKVCSKAYTNAKIHLTSLEGGDTD